MAGRTRARCRTSAQTSAGGGRRSVSGESRVMFEVRVPQSWARGGARCRSLAPMSAGRWSAWHRQRGAAARFRCGNAGEDPAGGACLTLEAVAPHATRLKAEDMTWKARLHSLRYVRPLLKLVWETSPPLVVASISLRLIRALMPLAMLWVPKLIIDAVVAWVSHRGGSLAHIWKLVALEFGLAVLSDFLSRAQQPVRQPARRSLHEPRQRPADAARHRARPRHVRGSGLS